MNLFSLKKCSQCHLETKKTLNECTVAKTKIIEDGNNNNHNNNNNNNNNNKLI